MRNLIQQIKHLRKSGFTFKQIIRLNYNYFKKHRKIAKFKN